MRPITEKRAAQQVAIAAGMLAIGAALACLMGYKVAGDVVVRCRRGHLFTTLWIPGVHLTSVDLGIARIQHCPVGHHWSVVVPVRDADLSDQTRAEAARPHDLRLP